MSEACVATGIKSGRLTGPWGRVKMEARARVVCSSVVNSVCVCEGVYPVRNWIIKRPWSEMESLKREKSVFAPSTFPPTQT